jgi:hypothetical protein
MDANSLKLSPLALQTALLRRWRADLGISFFENVISLHRRVPRATKGAPVSALEFAHRSQLRAADNNLEGVG